MDVTRLTEEEVDDALRTRRDPEALDAYFGPELSRELSRLAALPPRIDGAGRRSAVPRILILPGIMGSKLSVREADGDLDMIWIDPVDLARGGIHELRVGQQPDRVVASGVLWSAYLRMKYRLRWEGFDVAFLPYDWRHGIEALGDRALAEIRRAGTPAALVCHSMGGLVARRVAALAGPEEVPVIVTVGTPNLGAYSPVTALRLTHDYVGLLGRLDLRRGPKEIVERYIARFPGLLEMLPAPARRPDERYFDPGWWPPGGVVPEAALLAAAETAQAALPPPDARFHQIVGVGEETIVGARIEGERLVYDLSDDGDGTVPRDLAEMAGAAARYVHPGGHAWLCNRLDVIHGAAEIVETGRTGRLATEAPRAARRGTVTEAELSRRLRTRLPATRARAVKEVTEARIAAAFASAAGADFPADDPLRAAGPEAPAPPPPPVHVVSSAPRRRIGIVLLEGDILDAEAEALVVGVFQGVTALGGAAGALDAALGGALSGLMEEGQATGRPGEVRFLPAPRRGLRTGLAVLVGLGPLGRPATLEAAIRLAAGNLARALAAAQVSTMATVVWGAGTGLERSAAATALVDGLIAPLPRDAGRGLSRIALCERDVARHAALAEALADRVALGPAGEVEIVLRTDRLRPQAPRRGPATVPRQPDNLTVRGRRGEAQGRPVLDLRVTFSRGRTGSRYGPRDTAALPTCVRRVPLDALDDLLLRLQHAGPDRLPALAEDLADLVLAPEMRDNLDLDPEGGLVVTADAWGARVPWELLHGRGRAIATHGGLHRRYLTSAAGSRAGGTGRDRAGPARLLLVADPTGDLPGARREAEAVAAALATGDSGYRLDPAGGLRGARATRDAVLAELADAADPVDALHYAGHAVFDPEDRERSGLVLAGREGLGGADIAGLAAVPRVVILNACESARVRRAERGGDRERRPHDFLDRGTGLAEAFLLGGVSHLIGTVWPVGDADAGVFARAFHETAGDTDIGVAVTAARRRLAGEGRAAWVNYMHYGAPGGRFAAPRTG